MLAFDPPELRDRATKAFTILGNLLGDPDHGFLHDCHDHTRDDFDEEEHDIVIRENTLLQVHLPRCDDICEYTYAELIGLAEELNEGQLLNNLECLTPKRYLLRVEPVLGPGVLHYWETLDFTDGAMPVEIEYGGKRYTCGIVAATTAFGFMVTAKSYWDKYFPPVLLEDFFIQVLHSGCTIAQVREVCEAYQFEISSSAGFDLRANPRPSEASDWEAERPEGEIVVPPLRKLVVGPGMLELYQIYNQAISIIDPQIQILFYTRIFEFVSQTVIRQQLVDTFRAKLMSPAALNPTAGFILELEGMFERHKNKKKDREAIIATALACCETTELAKVAPPRLRKLQAIKATSKPNEINDALTEFGTTLVDTRNSIAHAKSNYEPTGEECPYEQLSAFANCARLAAQQVIRWFGDRPDSAKVL